MTSRRENTRRDVKIHVATLQRGINLTSRREIPRRDVAEKVSQELFDIIRSPLFRDSSRVNFILDIEHSARLAPMLPGPEIKPIKQKQ